MKMIIQIKTKYNQQMHVELYMQADSAQEFTMCTRIAPAFQQRY